MISLSEKEIAQEYLKSKNSDLLQDIPQDRIAVVWEYIDRNSMDRESVNIKTHPVFQFQEDNAILDQVLSLPETDIEKFKILSGQLESRLVSIESGGEQLNLKTRILDSDSESIQEAIGEIRENMDSVRPLVKKAWEEDIPELERVDFKEILTRVNSRDLEIQEIKFTDIYSSDSQCPYWIKVKKKKLKRKSKLKLEREETEGKVDEISDLSENVGENIALNVKELDSAGLDEITTIIHDGCQENDINGIDEIQEYTRNGNEIDEIQEKSRDGNDLDQTQQTILDWTEIDEIEEAVGDGNIHKHQETVSDKIASENLDGTVDDTDDSFQENTRVLFQENYDPSNHGDGQEKENLADKVVYDRRNKEIPNPKYLKRMNSPLLQRKRNQVALKETNSEKIKPKRKKSKEKLKKNQKISTTLIKQQISPKAAIQTTMNREVVHDHSKVILSESILSDMIRDAPNRHDLPMPEYDWNISSQRGSLEDFDTEFESQFANVAIQVTPKSDSTAKNEEFIEDKSLEDLDLPSNSPNTAVYVHKIVEEPPVKVFTSFALDPNDYSQHGLIHPPPIGYTYVCTLGYTPFSHSAFPIYILVPIDQLDTSVKSYFDSVSRDMFDSSVAESFLSKRWNAAAQCTAVIREQDLCLIQPNTQTWVSFSSFSLMNEIKQDE